MGFNPNDPRLKNSKWLGWEDLPQPVMQYRVIGVSIENFAPEDKSPDLKLALHLDGAPMRTDGSMAKPLGLNFTNRDMLMEAWGDKDTDAWIGQIVELRTERTNFQGKMVNCIRTYPAQPQQPIAAPVLGERDPTQPVAAPMQPIPASQPPVPPAGTDQAPADPFESSLAPPEDVPFVGYD